MGDADVDVWLQQCENCERWLSPDDDEIKLIESGAWGGSWVCPDCLSKSDT